MHTQFISKKSAKSHELTPWGITYPADSYSSMDLNNIDTTKSYNEIKNIRTYLNSTGGLFTICTKCCSNF